MNLVSRGARRVGVDGLLAAVGAAALGAAGGIALRRRQQASLQRTSAQAIERALAAERRFAAAFAASGLGIAITDETGVLVDANDAMGRLVGRTSAELIGHRLRELAPPGQDTADRLEDVRTRMAAGEPAVELEFPIQLPSGEVRNLHAVLAPMRDAAGRFTGLIGQCDDVTDVRAAEAERARLANRFEAVFRAAPAGIEVTADASVTDINPSLERIAGRSRAQLLIAGVAPFIVEEDAARIYDELRAARARGAEVHETEARLRRPDGSVRWIRTRIVQVADDPAVARIAHVEDITEAHDAQAALEVSHARFAALVERSSDIIAVVEADGRIGYASPAAEHLLGYATGSKVGTSFLDLVHPDDGPGLSEQFLALLADADHVANVSVRLRSLRGGWRNVEVVATNRIDDPAVRGVVANVRDVTERTEAAARLEWHAFHDALTGLPNRSLLTDRLGQALIRATEVGSETALLYIDLDRFKLVNDTLGHEAGDQLLQEVARRLRATVRMGDTVARLGGDEFVVLAVDLVGPEDASGIAAAIVASLSTSILLDAGEATVSASVGIAIARGHQPEELLRDADAALYRAKERGKARFEVFDDSLRIEAVHRISVEQRLRRALEHESFHLRYQPIVDLAEGSIVGVEALLRLDLEADPELDDAAAEVGLRPVRALEIAEESGLIIPIGARVVGRATAVFAALRATEPSLASARLSLNVSGRELSAPTFLDQLRHAVDPLDLEPKDVLLELTEATVARADRSTLATLERLHGIGFGLAMDDFGTGWSSLTNLQRLPLDVVKLDRSFVEGLGRNERDAEIARAVISLGRALDLRVVAEGVETDEQLAVLRALGCDLAQGHLFAVPTATPDVQAWIDRIAEVVAPKPKPKPRASRAKPKPTPS